MINTGNANAATGEAGLQAARLSCNELATLLDLRPSQILPFSTGVILEPLPVEKLVKGLPEAVKTLDANSWFAAAHSIMTTDTQPKFIRSALRWAPRLLPLLALAKGLA